MLARIISVLFLSFSSAFVAAQTSKPIELVSDAPDRHIVVPGDTLWGISGKFLKEPYRWPEIWRLNKEEIKNPHRIYPGQVVILDRSGAEPQLKLGNLVKLDPGIVSTDDRKEISAISQQVIEPFLSEPLVIEVNGLDTAPRIIATQEDRVYVGANDVVYATGVKSAGKAWQIYRPGKALVDPESNETLGYEAFYLGSARLTREGEPATLEVAKARQEIGRGDRLIPAAHADIISYVPHAPDADMRGRIVSVYGGLGEGGRYSIVSLSRGTRDKVEIGHVLAIYRAGAEVTDRFEGKKETFKLPDERYGLVFVFRVFDRVSYALVMSADRPVATGDVVRTP
jgi:hypothetical protein